jgi:hypothetical protein
MILIGKLLIYPPEVSGNPIMPSSSKAGETDEGNYDFCPAQYLFHNSKGSLTCGKIQRHGAGGFTSPSKEGVLRIFIAPCRV